jgi:type III secretory pathway component EscV
MPATTATARRRLRLATAAEVTFAALLVVALVAGAPTWELVVLAVLFLDAAAYGLWQLRAIRRHDAQPTGTATAGVAARV